MRRRIRPNESTGIPVNHLVLGTETTPVPLQGNPHVHVHRLRLGVARHFRFENGVATRLVETVFRDRNTILNWILDRANPKQPLWVWCHNAGFDLSAIGVWLLFESGELSLQRRSVGGSGQESHIGPKEACPGLCVTNDPPTIIRAYRADNSTFWFVDMLNWFLCPLRELGSAVGAPKLDMPGECASDSDWEVYCRRDVEILQAAVVGLLNFVKDNDLGNFRTTAASQSMAFFRHRCLTCRIDVDDQIPPKEFERLAYYGGRREVYFNGTVLNPGVAGLERMAGADQHLAVCHKGPVHHLDLVGAYPSVMRDNLFPVSRIGQCENESVERFRKRLNSTGAVAHVRISSGNSSWPTRSGERVFWARGDFDTYLCGPELIRAIDEGCVTHVYRAQIYALDNPFAKFVDEAWSLRKRYEGEGKPLYARLAKLLANALHGKFGQKSPRWEVVTDMLAPVHWGTYAKYWPETGRIERWRSIGGTAQVQLDSKEREDSFPLIAAYATAYARELMHRIRWVAGPREVFYEDADSIHVSHAGFNALGVAGWIHPDRLGGLRLVGIADRAVYRGPKDYTFGDKVVCAGISRQAAVDERGEWHQTNFDRLDALIGKQPPEGPIARDVTTSRPKPTIFARVAPDGWTEPVLIRGSKVIDTLQ